MQMTAKQYRERGKKSESEADLQTRVCAYLKKRGVRYRTDNDGVRVGFKARAAMAKQKDLRGFPDVVIREASRNGAGWKGLVIELKKHGTKVWRKDGTLKQDEHLKEQHEWLEWFRELGCKAEFACGYDQAVELVDEYFNFK